MVPVVRLCGLDLTDCVKLSSQRYQPARRGIQTAPPRGFTGNSLRHPLSIALEKISSPGGPAQWVRNTGTTDLQSVERREKRRAAIRRASRDATDCKSVVPKRLMCSSGDRRFGRFTLRSESDGLAPY